jgi:hypothetical protein
LVNNLTQSRRGRTSGAPRPPAASAPPSKVCSPSLVVSWPYACQRSGAGTKAPIQIFQPRTVASQKQSLFTVVGNGVCAVSIALCSVIALQIILNGQQYRPDALRFLKMLSLLGQVVLVFHVWQSRHHSSHVLIRQVADDSGRQRILSRLTSDNFEALTQVPEHVRVSVGALVDSSLLSSAHPVLLAARIHRVHRAPAESRCPRGRYGECVPYPCPSQC